ncbi:HpcH/HpaI aldolase/citrate lyase family protein [uncultured Pelagimonas sp.]|uniref:HpcH/HpaI aldolase/citrate lyase family protein n=1 Tax=uncultured Pelagimonas sp. TaxID=1618102 RepID=UPI00262DEABD|nr:HpcH/HpaI aldolase/citrate lyase family protein [uncultured Pelagimonas sp.]
MPAPLNPLKQALKSKELQVGCWVGFGNSYTTEIMCSAGFDWLLVDGEHAPNDLRSIMSQLQVIDPSPAHAVVRVPVGDVALMKQVLEIGAQSILVPMVESVEQASELVRSVQYPPRGIRGVGSALGRSSGFAAIPDYATTADDQICLILQVENRLGLDALDGILALDNVDAVFVGPADLAADLGHLGNPSHPDVEAIIAETLQKITASGKAAGILTTDLAAAKRYVDLGATFVGAGIDVTLFAQAARALGQSAQNLKD